MSIDCKTGYTKEFTQITGYGKQLLEMHFYWVKLKKSFILIYYLIV